MRKLLRMHISEWSLKYRIFKGILHKGKVHPRTGNEGPEREQTNSYTLL